MAPEALKRRTALDFGLNRRNTVMTLSLILSFAAVVLPTPQQQPADVVAMLDAASALLADAPR